MIDTTTYPITHFHDEVHEKRHIVLHYTAGYSASGAYSAFNKNKNGTAFIIERDGRIFQTYDPRYWCTHLYRHKKGEDKRLYEMEKHSIGIEIVNISYLVLNPKVKDNILYSYTKKEYCNLDETDRYVQKSFKGQHYWQAYTMEQYQAIRTLLASLSTVFHIPVNGAPAPAPRLNSWNLDILENYRGVTTHCNYRPDKLDVGPAFDWEAIGLSNGVSA